MVVVVVVVVVVIVVIVAVVVIIIHPDASSYRDDTCYGEERKVKAEIGGSPWRSYASRSLGARYLRFGLVLFVVLAPVLVGHQIGVKCCLRPR